MFYIFYLILLILLILLYFRIARRYGIVDEPIGRSSHVKPVIRGAGIIVPAGLLCWFIWSGFQYPWFIAGLLLVSAISFLDDISHIMRGVRIIVQLAAIILLLMQAGYPQVPLWVTGVTLFVTLGIINAFNFMDGINGMMGLFSLSALVTLWYINEFLVPFADNSLIYASGIALLVFGFFNFRRHATCFAGDVGPVAVSFILIFLLSRLIITTGNIFYLWLLAVFGIDSALTILHRIILKENIVLPHRRHLYQILANEKGIPHLRISGGYTLLQLIINAIMLWVISRYPWNMAALTGAAIILILCVVYIVLKWNILTNQPQTTQPKPLEPNQ